MFSLLVSGEDHVGFVVGIVVTQGLTMHHTKPAQASACRFSLQSRFPTPPRNLSIVLRKFPDFCRIFCRGTGPRGLEMAAACLGVESEDLGAILDPFRTIFDDLGPNRLSETSTV